MDAVSRHASFEASGSSTVGRMAHWEATALAQRVGSGMAALGGDVGSEARESQTRRGVPPTPSPYAGGKFSELELREGLLGAPAFVPIAPRLGGPWPTAWARWNVRGGACSSRWRGRTDLAFIAADLASVDRDPDCDPDRDRQLLSLACSPRDTGRRADSRNPRFDRSGATGAPAIAGGECDQ